MKLILGHYRFTFVCNKRCYTEMFTPILKITNAYIGERCRHGRWNKGSQRLPKKSEITGVTCLNFKLLQPRVRHFVFRWFRSKIGFGNWVWSILVRLWISVQKKQLLQNTNKLRNYGNILARLFGKFFAKYVADSIGERQWQLMVIVIYKHD